ncbi:MAG TPA: IS1182 family transposase [Tepidiformaceae bacterium]|nr:IS1182 family transposase [Tepidiformaceae bacterium]
MKTYRPYTPTQAYLLPPSPLEWLPSDHLAYFILDLVAELDLGAIERALQAKDARGERPYSPRMMTGLLMYGYAVGVFSSRKIERATVEDVAFRILAGNQRPHFTTVNEFRAKHREALAGLFVQVLRECQSAGLVKLGHVAIDGTKMKANASKHKAMSYERMNKDEERLKAEVASLFERAEAIDAAEDAEYGVGQSSHDLPAELRRREDRLAKIREVRAALKEEAAKARAGELRAQAESLREKAADPSTAAKEQGYFNTLAAKRDAAAKKLDDDDQDPPTAQGTLPLSRPPTTKDGSPKPNAQRNFTDPDSRIMLRDGSFLQAYNAQIAVDEDHQIIVAAAVSNHAADTGYLVPMLERVVENCDAVPERTTADAGYFSASNVRAAEHMGTEPFISVGKHHNDGTQAKLPAHYNTPTRLSMRALLHSPRGRAAYARRKATVEPVFGQIRSCRGFRAFSFRGLLKTGCEWLFVCLTHNVLKLWRHALAVASAPVAT